MYHAPDDVAITAEGPIRIITFQGPSMTASLHRFLGDVWTEIADDADASVVIITGSGDQFLVGGELHYVKRVQSDADFRDMTVEEARRILYGMMRFPLPIIAAVNGPAVGIGCSIALSCDIVLLADLSFLADPHVSAGLVCGDGGAALWPALASPMRAKEFLFTGGKVFPLDAVEMGLASRVVPALELNGRAMKLARTIAKQPKQALRDTKRAVNLHIERATAGVLEMALLAERESMASSGFGAWIDTMLEDREVRATK